MAEREIRLKRLRTPVYTEDHVRALEQALREAEAQRDDANGCLEALGQRYDEQRGRAEAAERTLKLRTGVFMAWMARASQDGDEYRQALRRADSYIAGTWCGDADCKHIDLKCIVARLLARDARRVEQPRQ